MQPAVERLFREEPGELIVPAPVLAEADYLLGRRGGRHARLALLDDLASGRFVLASISLADLIRIRDLESRYPDLDPGLTDLAVVVTAANAGSTRIATFDDHFRVLRPIDGRDHFEILPG
jgi:uncharacterized protein